MAQIGMKFIRIILASLLLSLLILPLSALADSGSISVFSSGSDGYGYATDATYSTAQAAASADAVDLSSTTMLLGQRAPSSYDDSFYGDSSDGYLKYIDATYNTAWAASTAEIYADTQSTSWIGQRYYNSAYDVPRHFAYFDTSALPDDATITSATLKLYGWADWSYTDFDITVQNGQPTYPHDPLVVGDFDKSYYSSDGGTLNTSSFQVESYNSITLNATGMGWISLTGMTKLCLRSSREIAGTTPTGVEMVIVYTADYAGTSKDPILEVTYTTPISNEYRVDRAYVYFDTSGLPDTCTITSATLQLYGATDYSDTDFDVQIQDGQPTYPHDPLVTGDFDKTNYSGDGGSFNTYTFTTSGYNDITLNSTGLTWISKTSTTKLCLRSDEDIGVSSPSGDEYISFYTTDYTGIDHDPKLIVNYTTATTGIIITHDATNISTTYVTLQGEITSLEGESYASVFFEYGTTTSYGTVTESQAVASTGTFAQEVTGLRFNTTYHFRAGALIGGDYFYGEDNTYDTILAEGSSTDMVIISVGIFSDYRETGDYLFCVETINTYSGYYPNLSASKYFQVQLIDVDGVTILGAAPLSNWGDRPTAIYLNSTQSEYIIDFEDYFIRMVGVLVTGIPYVEYEITDDDWYGVDLEGLDDWCIGVATNMQVSDGRSDYLTVLTDVGIVIDDAAGGYFTAGIPGITQVRPTLFATYTITPPWPTGDDESSWDDDDAWETYVGANITADANKLGLPFGTGGKEFLGGIIALSVVMCMMLVVGSTGGFGALGAVLIAIPLVWVGTYFKIVPIQVISILMIGFGLLAIRQFVVKST